MKIAIDGPSASGKGTISKILAQKLGCTYLNTGKIYRIVAFTAFKMEGDLKQNALQVCKEIAKHFKEQSNEQGIYSEENAKLTSYIATMEEVRESLLEFQKSFAKTEERVILEGRDIGTVIMPNADFKFYLDASPSERARRRALQIGSSDMEKILKEITERDANDAGRKVAALKRAEDAIYIDTTTKTIEETVEEILNIIGKK